MKMETILIVDDEKNYPPILAAVMEEEGFEPLMANSGEEALNILKHSDVDLVLTDMKMPSMDGIELLENVKQKDPELPVIMMTAHGTVEKAVEAMQKGAYSYIMKPFDNDSLVVYVNKAIAMYRVIKENRRLRKTVESQYSFGNIIGKSKRMQDVFEKVQSLGSGFHSVSLTGGEPLLEKEFLLRLFPVLANAEMPVYLETNGILHEALKDVLESVDIISMDIKLPSSTGEEGRWAEHEEFLKTALPKDVFVKTVVTPMTAEEDIEKAAGLIAGIDPCTTLIIQPESKSMTGELIGKCRMFQERCSEKLNDVRIIPQIHKYLGVK